MAHLALPFPSCHQIHLTELPIVTRHVSILQSCWFHAARAVGTNSNKSFQVGDTYPPLHRTAKSISIGTGVFKEMRRHPRLALTDLNSYRISIKSSHHLHAPDAPTCADTEPLAAVVPLQVWCPAQISDFVVAIPTCDGASLVFWLLAAVDG